MSEIDVAGGDRFRAVGIEFDVAQVNEAAVEHELRFHVRPERYEVLNGHGASVEGHGTVIVRNVHDIEIDVWRHHAPGRLMVFKTELSALGTQKLQCRHEASGT